MVSTEPIMLTLFAEELIRLFGDGGYQLSFAKPIDYKPLKQHR